jgi:predicted DNA-binding protein
MNKDDVIEKINILAEQDEKRRQDPKYLKVMGFLVAKGFLHTNTAIALYPNENINLKEAIWAGRNVEPRILEVLPAAYERFPKHFYGNRDIIEKLEQIIDCVKQKGDRKIDFCGIPVEKLKPWFFIRLRDGRSKSLDQRKVSKNFRFKPETIEKLKNLKIQTGQSETEILEKLIAAAIHSAIIYCVFAIRIVGF